MAASKYGNVTSRKVEEEMARARVYEKVKWLQDHNCDYARVRFYKRGKERWKAQYTSGKAGRKFMEAPTEEALIDRLYEHFKQLNDTPVIRHTTLHDGLDRFIADKEDNSPAKASTIERLRYKANFWKGLYDADIRELTKNDLNRYMKETCPFYTQQAMKESLQLLHNAYALALENGDIDTDVSITVTYAKWKKCCKQTDKAAEYKIFTEAQIAEIEGKACTCKPDMRAYMLLLSIKTGMRAGELSALDWFDVKWNEAYIHVHTQMIERRENKRRIEYEKVLYTKNECGDSKDGRKVFFLSEDVEILLREIYALTGDGDYVFRDGNGERIKPDNYEHWLHDRQKDWGYEVTNNHAFRKSLNSNILIGKLGMTVTERAKFLGHSEEVNLKNYTYIRDDQYEESMRRKIDAHN